MVAANIVWQLVQTGGSRAAAQLEVELEQLLFGQGSRIEEMELTFEKLLLGAESVMVAFRPH